MSERDVIAFADLVDLAAESLGGRALIASDDFFAAKDNLLRAPRAVFEPDRYTERGKWMDGWESRRRRVPGHDWCIVRLGVPGRIRAVDIDTDHFLGNHAPYASLEGCVADPEADGAELRDTATWVPVIRSVPLDRGSRNLCSAITDQVFTHVRLNIYPDGGVARLRVYGEPHVELPEGGAAIDLASTAAGGRAIVCSDAFFSPMNNLIAPGRSTFMGGGWETRRSRPPGADFIVVQLGQPGVLERIVLETHHFRGNYPDRASVDGLYWPSAPPQALAEDPGWRALTASHKLRADAQHTLEILDPGPVTHLRLQIVPDGGISRMRALGHPTARTPADTDPLLQQLAAMSDAEARAALARCCGATRWIEAMLAARPFTSRVHLLGAAAQIWWHLGDGDWREAFEHHPRIGADLRALRERFADTVALSEGEQAGIHDASEQVLEALAEGNRAYEERFGHIFIVCASGLTAEEMLARLTTRLELTPEAELRIAAEAVAQITELRLLGLEER